MKAKILNILRRAKKVFLYILIIGLILEAIIVFFFGNIINSHPRFINLYNYALAVNSLFLVFGIIFLPASDTGKIKKINKKRKNWVIHILKINLPVRGIFFVSLGILCALYFILSKIFFNEIEAFNKVFRLCSILFIPIYLLVYYTLSRLFFKSKKEVNYVTYNSLTGFDDMILYGLGMLAGGVIFIVLAFIFLGFFAIIWLGKCIIWLTYYPLVSFGIIISLMYFLTCNNPKQEEKTVSK